MPAESGQMLSPYRLPFRSHRNLGVAGIVSRSHCFEGFTPHLGEPIAGRRIRDDRNKHPTGPPMGRCFWMKKRQTA